MDILVLNAADVRRLLPVADCIDVMADALSALARGDAVQPLRSFAKVPPGGGDALFGTMPAYLGSPFNAAGVKVIGVWPGNRELGIDSHQGVVTLFDGHHGQPTALLDGGAITEIRTAAASGLATRLLARPDAARLALLGVGAQAECHLDAICAVRDIQEVLIWNRDRAKAEQLVERRAAQGLAISLRVVAHPRVAVEAADILCTLTSAVEPIVAGSWLRPGCHINAVGACVPTAREFDAEALTRARLFTDRRESMFAEAGNYILAVAEGAFGDRAPPVIELGEVLQGEQPGRTANDEITLFESLGIAVEDVAAAHHVWKQATARGMGPSQDLAET